MKVRSIFFAVALMICLLGCGSEKIVFPEAKITVDVSEIEDKIKELNEDTVVVVTGNVKKDDYLHFFSRRNRIFTYDLS